MAFENFRVAVEACTRHKLGAVQVVLKAEEEPLGVPIPAIESAADAPRFAPVLAGP